MHGSYVGLLAAVEVEDVLELAQAAVDWVPKQVVALQLVFDLAVREQPLSLYFVQAGYPSDWSVKFFHDSLSKLAVGDELNAVHNFFMLAFQARNVCFELVPGQVHLVVVLAGKHLGEYFDALAHYV